MNIADIMIENVRTVRADATLLDALREMVANRISGLPVVDDSGGLVGIITEGDLLRRAETGSELHRPRWLEFMTSAGRLANEYIHAHGRRVSELMSGQPKTVSDGASVAEAVELMLKHHIKRLPVVRDGTLVGIVSRGDIVKALLHNVEAASGKALSDSEVRGAILAEVEKQDWAPRGTIRVAVKDGVVEFDGSIFAESTRQGLRVIAENVPGVVGVIDHLIWVEPMSGFIVEAPAEETATHS